VESWRESEIWLGIRERQREREETMRETEIDERERVVLRVLRPIIAF